MESVVRVALIGNSFASTVQIPALRWAGGNRIVGIAGADADKARATANDLDIPFATGDWRELLERDADLVVISTPVHLHAEMVRAALDADAAILCEKPFTLNAAEATELVDAARGRLCLLDHQLRWSPWRRALRQRLAQVGGVWSGRMEMRNGSSRRRGARYGWWYDAERGGGTLGAIASHMLDSLQLDLGSVAAVRARLATYVPERRDAGGVPRRVTADEHATLWLRMQSGAEVTVEANLMSPNASPSSLVEYVGSNGTLRLVDETRLSAGAHEDELDDVEVDAHVPTFAELGTPDMGIFARVLPLYLRDVLAAVRDGRTELPGAATFEDGLATMRVLDAARQSAREATWVPCAP